METHMTEATRNAKLYVQKNQEQINADAECKLAALCADAQARIEAVKAELDQQLEQETLQLTHDHKISMTNISESHKLSLVIRSKDCPSPLTSKPRKSRKQKAGTYAGPL